MQTAETHADVREALTSRRITQVEFGSPREPEIRSMALHLDNGQSVVLTATAWQTITVEH